jgi:peptidoglycan glycosyltransferase
MRRLGKGLRALAGLACVGLAAYGLASGDEIADARWLAILGAAWLLLLVATWFPLPRTIPHPGRTTIRTAVVLATVFALVSAQLLRIQIVTREETVDRVAIAPNGDVAGNPRRQQTDLRVRRGRVYDRNGTILADTVRDGELWRRVYPEPESAYVVGYYAPLQYGSAGLEATYDNALTGETDAGSLAWLERDVLHRPQQGDDLILTLDADLQRTAHELLDGRIGAAVLIDVSTGAVLVLASNPHWDPNALAAVDATEAGDAADYWADLAADPNRPLVARATLGLYPPGSTFKTVTAGAAIDAGFADPDRVYVDDGDLDVDGRVIVENNRPDPSRIEWTLTEGLAWSLNVVFAQVGLALGPDGLRAYAERFGFGAEVPFDLPVATSQIESATGFIDNPVALADTAFGQGQILATPLQMALVAACFANGGTIMEPYLVDRIVAPDGQVVEHTEPTAWRQVVSPQTATQVREMMIASASDGYAAAAALPGLTVGGKTGTAETGAGEPHAWFIGFAGHPEPRYAVAVVLEHGGSGLAGALFVGRDLLAAALEAGSSTSAAPSGERGALIAPSPINPMYVRNLSPAPALFLTAENGRIRHARSGGKARRATSASAIRAIGRPRIGRAARGRSGDARQRRGRRRGRADAGADRRRPPARPS